VQERAKLWIDRRGVWIALDVLDQFDTAVELQSGERAVRVLAEDGPVAAGDVGRDQLPVASRQRVVCAQQLLRESIEVYGCFGPELHRAADSGHVLRQIDVRH
jgi:hypothetical protein